MAVYIGVDPGANGGVAILFDEELITCPIPKTEKDIWDFFCQWGEQVWRKGQPELRPFALIEKVQGHIGLNQPGSAMFNFGYAYGILRMALTGAGIPYECIPPQKWQKALGVIPRHKNESKTDFKNRLKQRAQQLYPGVRITLQTADAILICEYLRRLKEGEI